MVRGDLADPGDDVPIQRRGESCVDGYHVEVVLDIAIPEGVVDLEGER